MEIGLLLFLFSTLTIPIYTIVARNSSKRRRGKSNIILLRHSNKRKIIAIYPIQFNKFHRIQSSSAFISILSSNLNRRYGHKEFVKMKNNRGRPRRRMRRRIKHFIASTFRKSKKQLPSIQLNSINFGIRCSSFF